jgi:hypothetical protein
LRTARDGVLDDERRMTDLQAAECTGEDYWSQAQRPLAALLFLLPLLIVYELGVLSLGGEQADLLRNAADCWLRQWLLAAGMMHPWLLPAAVIGLLGGWHLTARHPWRCSLETLVGMLAESLLFAMMLVLIGQGLHFVFEQTGGVLSLPPSAAVASGPAARALGYVGAGIYEEVLFRLVMLPLCVTGLLIVLPRREASIAAVCLTSVVFAAAHYIEPGGDGWVAAVPGALERVADGATLRFSFMFRAVAGGLFGVLFLRRGFGVTVGAHALYDLLVGVVMQPA